MPDLMAHYRDYVVETKKRLEASGFNSNMAAVYGIMLEIADKATDQEQFRRLSDEKNLNLETYRASALDTYGARLRQAGDDGLKSEKAVYETMLENIRKAQDQTEIANEITSGMDKVTAERKKRDAREYNMRGILDNLIDYFYTSPLLDLTKFVQDVTKRIGLVREAGGDSDAMLRDPKWREPYHLADPLWESLVNAYEDIKAGRMPNKEKAQEELNAEYSRTGKVLSGLKKEMRQHGEILDAKKERERSSWVSWATPTGYDFECVWRKGE
jgi:hypothetical protein